MKSEQFEIFDSIACVYFLPYYSTNIATGRRMFADLINDPNSTLSKHPGDYTLFSTGTFENTTGEVVPHPHSSLGTGLMFVELDQNQNYPTQEQEMAAHLERTAIRNANGTKANRTGIVPASMRQAVFGNLKDAKLDKYIADQDDRIEKGVTR